MTVSDVQTDEAPMMKWLTICHPPLPLTTVPIERVSCGGRGFTSRRLRPDCFVIMVHEGDGRPNEPEAGQLCQQNGC